MKTYILNQSDEGPVILWGMYRHREDELEATEKCIKEQLDTAAYTLLAYEVTDWNGDFSPWRAKELDASFAGNAEKTLDFVLRELIPQIKQKQLPDRPVYLLGYSLAGLFSLWALTKTNQIAGVGSCSGSLWYPGFCDYLAQQEHLCGRRIYLSLGGKEAKTKNPLMATIAERTKETERYLKQRNIVKWEMNAGGHFADSGKRLAKAVKWIVS